MRFYALGVVSLAFAPALSLGEPRPYLRRATSSDHLLGLMKRQGHPPPDQQTCGFGDTCAEACGPYYIQCPSTDGTTHCFDPTVLHESCCSEGSGLSCEDGFYCTQDNAGDPWCCPNDLDLDACAALLTVTGLSTLSAITAAPNATATATSVPTPPANSTFSTLPSATFTGAANPHVTGGVAVLLALAGALAAM